MKKLFLHIGFNKTGSSSIQQNLSLNENHLMEQGIFYPNDANAPFMQRWQHVPLAAAVPGCKIDWVTKQKKRSLDRAYKSLFALLERTRFDTLLLSTEGFGSLTMKAKQLRWLQEQFAGYDIRVIAYVRRQDSYLLSAYQQRVKAGGKGRFRFEMHEDMAALRFDERLAPWRAVFGARNVVVRPFVPALWPEGELFYDFLQAIGCDHSGMILAPPTNEGLDYRAVELLRAVNTLDLNRAQKRHVFLDLAAQIDRFMPPDFTPQKMALSSTQANSLRAYYRDHNIAALAGSGVNLEQFFPEVPPGRQSRLPPDTLPPDMLLELLARLSLHQRQTPTSQRQKKKASRTKDTVKRNRPPQ
jgi:hypothetical protein